MINFYIFIYFYKNINNIVVKHPYRVKFFNLLGITAREALANGIFVNYTKLENFTCYTGQIFQKP